MRLEVVEERDQVSVDIEPRGRAAPPRLHATPTSATETGCDHRCHGVDVGDDVDGAPLMPMG
jgi:hypothetical protein